jgi:hypothetical protein
MDSKTPIPGNPEIDSSPINENLYLLYSSTMFMEK